MLWYSKGTDFLLALPIAALLSVQPGFCENHGILDENVWVDPVMLHWRSLLQVIMKLIRSGPIMIVVRMGTLLEQPT
jgi:hypothetical protein